ncbi:MAG: hypothetical protein H7X88_05375 [Gloeobacteraceae cyanobacterium ES-bin-316]|nr:hypothetical protein [Ferruginibacter sp.]
MTLKQKIYQPFLWVIFLFLCGLQSKSQAVQTAINTNDILIGEQIRYEIKINLANSSYNIDIGIPDSIPHFDIIDQSKYDTVDAAGVYTLKQSILFTSFDSGVWKIPSFPVSISFPNKATQRFLSDSFLVRVGYSPADSTGLLRDIKPVMEVFVIDRQWMYIAAAIFTALLLIYFIYRYFKTRKKKAPALFSASLSAYDQAMKALNEMQKQVPADGDAQKIFYVALSDIFKKYYSRKTNKNLMSITTGDLLVLLQSQIQSPQILSEAAEALRCGDAVKFAKYNPGQTQVTQSVLQIKNTIEQLEKKSAFK